MQKRKDPFYGQYEQNYNWNNDQVFDLDQILDFYVYQPSENQVEKEEKPTADTGTSQIEETYEDNDEQIQGERSTTVIETKNVKQNELKVWEQKNLNLNKFVHQETLLHLKQLKRCKILTFDEVSMMEKYEGSGSSFKAHFQLFKNHQGLRNRCNQLYMSTEFVNRVLCYNANFQRKLALLKHLEKFKSCIHGGQRKKRWEGNLK